jgi:hypothetical protein
VPLTYSLLLDLDDGGPPLDLSADVRALEWRLGAEKSGQSVAPPGRARITVCRPNPPWPEGWAALVGRWLILRTHDGQSERPHFSGLIDRVAPAAGPDGRGLAVIEAVTADAGLAELTAALGPVTDAAPGPLLRALLDALPLRRPSLRAVWVLGVGDFSALGSSTRPADSLALEVHGDTGISRFAFAALGGLRAADALRQIVVSEGGRCAVGRGGRLVLRDRHDPLRERALAASFAGAMRDLELVNGDHWANQVRVRFYPAVIGAPGTPLWALERPQKLPPGVRRLTVHFRNASGEPCAAWSAGPLLATAATAPEGGHPALIEALLIHADARSATLEFRNPGPAALWLTTPTRLLGTPLQLGPALEAEHCDAVSIAFHGPRRRTLDLALTDALDEADSRARFELLCAPHPQAHAQAVTLDLRAAPAALAVTMGDRIHLRDPTTGHDATYDVIGEAHTVDQGGARHRVRLVLDPVPQASFWQLGLRALDSATTLAH